MFKIIFIFAIHMGLAYLMKQSAWVSTSHALLTLFGGLVWALKVPKKKNERALYLCAYIAGAEVLWRMTKALVFWEFGKYAIILILCLTSARYLFSKANAWVYFLSLVPSFLMVIGDAASSFDYFRKEVSYNLSGPLALAVCYACYSKFKITGDQLRKSILALCWSLSGAAFLCLFGLYKAGAAIKFGTESSFAASGGFGPNQVSAVMGLGALLIFIYCLDPGRKMNIRNLMIVFGLWFAGQSALTFSRAGLVYAVVSIAVSGLFFIQNTKTRNRFLMFLVVLFAVGNFVVLPYLDRYTQGNLTARFNERTTTGRSDIMKDELRLFKENLLMGVGVGQAKIMRTDHSGVASHTEFTRLLAEHGSLGLLAILVMLMMAAEAFLKAKTPKAKAVSIAFSVWTFCFMMGNGMRLVAPSFAFGLCAITLIPDTPLIYKSAPTGGGRLPTTDRRIIS